VEREIGVAQILMISVFGKVSVLIGRRVTSNETVPARTVRFSPSAHETVTTVAVCSARIAFSAPVGTFSVPAAR
jgi:hypothetical protein